MFKTSLEIEITEKVRSIFKSKWNFEDEDEAIQPTVCHWANGSINVDKQIVFKYDEADHEDPAMKGGPKSSTSHTKKKMSLQNTISKKFKDFKPQPMQINEEIKVNPKLEKEMEIEKQNIEAEVS